MWALDNRTRFAAERTWVRDGSGRHQWVVALKATFQIRPGGSLRIADQQEAPLYEPEYYGAVGRSSLRYEADLTAGKPGTDVIVNAHAHAPKGIAAAHVLVSLRVGEVDKTLLVFGARSYKAGFLGIKVTDSAKFLSKPIVYEAAFGGVDTSDADPRKHAMDDRNPVGRGFAVHSSSLDGCAAPDIEYPRGDPSRCGPAGFGAIASYWSPRLQLAGTYGERWNNTTKPLLPSDYDERHLLCSPADQRTQRLIGGERIELENMTAEGILRLELPRLKLSFRSYFGRKVKEQPAHLASVIIEPEKEQLLLVWHSTLAVGPLDVDYLDRTLIEEKVDA